MLTPLRFERCQIKVDIPTPSVQSATLLCQSPGRVYSASMALSAAAAQVWARLLSPLLAARSTRPQPLSDKWRQGHSETRTAPPTYPMSTCPRGGNHHLRSLEESHVRHGHRLRILDGIVGKNDDHSWDRLFRFSSRCLRVPRRGGHRRSLATEVNLLLREECDQPPLSSTLTTQPRSRPKRNHLETLASRVSIKLEGDYKGAVRHACSDDPILDLNEETLSALRSKHLPPHPNSCNPPPPEESITCVLVSEKDVAESICTFPNGLAGGPDGLHPQHLKDLTSPSAEGAGVRLIQSITAFINHLSQGGTPLSVRHVFFGAIMIPLGKKDTGVRPIAVGNTL